MKPFMRKALFAGIPVITGATLLGASPAFADGPTESLSTTTTHTNGQGFNFTCTLTLNVITDYQGNPNLNLASFDMTNVGDCLDASLSQSVLWVTPEGGTAQVFNSFGPTALLPTHSQDVYQPVNGSISKAQFTENGNLSFDNCIANCTMSLSLTADGVK